MKKHLLQQRAFTLIELLVVISIIAILAGVSLPVFGQVQTKGRQNAALQHAKQIGLALKIYAGDHDGRFPSTTVDENGDPTNTVVTDSNQAFAQLFPDYNQTEKLFYVAKSAWNGIKPPDEDISENKVLEAKENHWAYVTNLTDTSNASFPLIADGFTTSGADKGVYSVKEDEHGGVWKGTRAIVIRADVSGSVEDVDKKDLFVRRKGATGNKSLFEPADDWLGATQKAVNPKAGE